MRNRTIISIVVIVLLLIAGYFAFTTPGSPLYPGSSGESSVSSSSISSVTPVSSVSSVTVSSASSVASSVSSRSSSSAMSETGSSSSFAQTSPRETVSHFYLEWATYGGFINNELAATSPFLTSRMRTSVDSAEDIFCNERQPLNFTTVLLSRGDSEATVQVNERYASGNVTAIVTVRSEDEAWRIDGVTCEAASSSSSSL